MTDTNVLGENNVVCCEGRMRKQEIQVRKDEGPRKLVLGYVFFEFKAGQDECSIATLNYGNKHMMTWKVTENCIVGREVQ